VRETNIKLAEDYVSLEERFKKQSRLSDEQVATLRIEIETMR
jgi:chromosome segregation ATPase